MTVDKRNLILELTFSFSIDIIEYCELLEEKKKFVIARQLLKSGTSIGANIRESQLAESKLDFIHKLKISEKEANETEYWLLLCKHARSYPFDEKLLQKLLSIKKILAKIITTSKSSLKKNSLISNQ
jgi:four helix bundle protein